MPTTYSISEIFPSGLTIQPNLDGSDTADVAAIGEHTISIEWGSSLDDNERTYLCGSTVKSYTNYRQDAGSGSPDYNYLSPAERIVGGPLRVPYPSGSQKPESGDILFLVLRGRIYDSNILSFEVDENIWTRVGESLYIENDNNATECLDVYYHVVDNSVTTINGDTKVVARVNPYPGSPNGLYWAAVIMGYRGTTYPKEVSFNYENSGNLNTFEFLARPQYPSDFFEHEISNPNSDPFLSGPITSCRDFDDEPGGTSIHGPTLTSQSIDPWAGYGDPEFDSYHYNDTTMISISAPGWVAWSGPNYSVNSRESSTKLDGWRVRSSISSPATVIGDAKFIYDSPNNPSGHPELKSSPELPIGYNTRWLQKVISISGYHKNKKFEATGYSAMNGIMKITPIALPSFTKSSNFIVSVNGLPVVYMDTQSYADANIHQLEINPSLSNENYYFEYEDGSIGINIKYGDKVTFEARSIRSTSETLQKFIIEGFPMNYDVVMSTDLRDSGGHKMNIIRMQDFGTTYPLGGLVLTAEDFGLNEIVYMQIQSGTAWAPVEGEPSILVSQTTCSSYFNETTGETYWKINVFIPDAETGLPVELAEGSSLEFPDALRPTLMVMGA